MFTSASAPSVGPPGNGQSYLKHDLVFTRFDDGSVLYRPNDPTTMEVFVLRQTDFMKLGYERTVQSPSGPQGQQVFCCDEEAKVAGLCDKLNTLITAEMPTPAIFRTEIEILPAQSGHLAVKVEFPDKDLYVSVFASCNSRTGLLQVDGTTTWLNPYGYLPGEKYGYMVFFEGMTYATLMTAAAWFALCAYHWRELMVIQMAISLLILLSMLEASFHYEYYMQLNKHGADNVSLLVAGVTFNTLKRTCMRSLILATSMGLGVTRHTLGVSTQYTILVLSGFYFVFAEAQYLIENLTASATPVFPEYLIMGPLITLDVGFGSWIFRELLRTIVHLHERRQTNKIRVYRCLQATLVVFIGAAIVVPAVQLRAITSGWMLEHWESSWMYRCVWHILYHGVLVVIMSLWRPRTRGRARLGMQQVATMEEGTPADKGIEMATAGEPKSALERAETQLYEGLGLGEEDGRTSDEVLSGTAHKAA